MDYLQYWGNKWGWQFVSFSSFKPYYKWITFNTSTATQNSNTYIPSFKPYYKWITFNTYEMLVNGYLESLVLNLIINGLPSIHNFGVAIAYVLISF